MLSAMTTVSARRSFADARQHSGSHRRCLLLSGTRSDQVANHDQAGGDTDPGLQRSTGLQLAHRRDQFQSDPYRSLGVILMRLRIPEVDKDTVAHVLRDEPAEALFLLWRHTSDRPK